MPKRSLNILIKTVIYYHLNIPLYSKCIWAVTGVDSVFLLPYGEAGSLKIFSKIFKDLSKILSRAGLGEVTKLTIVFRSVA